MNKKMNPEATEEMDYHLKKKVTQLLVKENDELQAKNEELIRENKHLKTALAMIRSISHATIKEFTTEGENFEMGVSVRVVNDSEEKQEEETPSAEQ